MQPAQTSRPVISPIAGSVVVTVDELSSKLGRPAWRVWECLLTRRDERGQTHATKRGIANAAGFEQISERAVKHGLARLVAAGLVHNVGWLTLPVPGRDGATTRRKVYVRVVYGARAGLSVSLGKRVALVPERTARWLETAHKHGRPRGTTNVLQLKIAPATKVKLSKPENGEFEGVEAMGGKSKGSSFRSDRSVGIFNGAQVGVEKDGPPIKILSTDREKRTIGEYGQFARCARELTRARPALFRTESGDGDNASILLTPGDDRSSQPMQVRGASIPPPPCDLNLPMVRVGPPPALDKRLGFLRAKAFLARAYRAAYLSRFENSKKASALFARGKRLDDRISKIIPYFNDDIRPASWFAWCFDRAVDYDWIVEPWWPLSVSFLRRHRDWYFETHAMETGRMIMVPAHRELWERWRQMNQALRHAKNELDVRRAIRDAFPGNLYEELINKTHEQHRKTQVLYDKLTASGDLWVW